MHTQTLIGMTDRDIFEVKRAREIRERFTERKCVSRQSTREKKRGRLKEWVAMLVKTLNYCHLRECIQNSLDSLRHRDILCIQALF